MFLISKITLHKVCLVNLSLCYNQCGSNKGNKCQGLYYILNIYYNH